MAALGPFERRPRLAVAVSGGPDSMCLSLLASHWARERGGDVSALTVDHVLRPTSGAEARQVAAWMKARRIAHHVLRWTGAKPATGIQVAARDARYRLLGDWCRAAGAMHLLLAHHLDDQAETVALRRARQSGADGLAGMAAVRELRGLRLLRPLLGVPKARLRATLEAAGQPWLEDPSNSAPAFARSRLRLGLGLDALPLVRLAQAHAPRRAAGERRAACWLAAHARIDPAGYVTMPSEALGAAPSEIRRRVVQQILRSVGGRRYPPREARLCRLLEQIPGGLAGGRTLAGCRILPWRDAVLVCREPEMVGAPQPLAPGTPVVWDSRFRLELRGDAPVLVVRALNDAGLQCLASLPGPTREVPAPVRPGLPSLWDGEALVAVPHLGVVSPPLAHNVGVSLSVLFNPSLAVAGGVFYVRGRQGTRSLLRHAESLC